MKRQGARHPLEELVGVGGEEIVLVAVVLVEGRPADAGAVEHVLHRDRVERLLLHQLDQRGAERGAAAAHPGVDLPPGAMRARAVTPFSGHQRWVCSGTASVAGMAVDWLNLPA